LRILHTADWHAGRSLMNVSREQDIREAVERIVTIAREERPDLILHAGDLFDALRPGVDDMHWVLDRLRELAAVAPVYVLCGNHDSPALFALFDKLLGPRSRIRFVPRVQPADAGGVVEVPGPGDEIARIAFCPFIHASRIVDHFEQPDTWMASYADRVGRIAASLDQGLHRGYDPGRHVLLYSAHLFVTGARFSQSERPITVSDAYAARSEDLPVVSYCAFGHVHRPQPLPGHILGRYAGSVVPFDFGEMDEPKEVVLVDARPGRAPTVEARTLDAGRPLRRIEGTLEEIERIAPEVGRALCLVRVRTERPLPNISEHISQLLPEATLLDVFEDCAATRLTPLTVSEARAAASEASFVDLFHDYLAASGVRAGSADRVLRTFRDLLSAVENEQQALLPEIDELEREVPR
jgi:DNA repair protein SbcD/Mre11